MKVVADDKIPFLKGVLEPYADVVYLPGSKIDNSVLQKADALITRTRTKCNKELLDKSGIRFIATATIGFDHIDTRYCDDRKITWTNAPGCNSSSVQQYIASALMRISSENHFMLRDKTLGIIGVGNVGSKVEKFAAAVGMKLLLNDPPRARREDKSHFVDFETILRESDIITLHVPLNKSGDDKTWHLINEQTIQKMKKGAWLINSSRGEVVDNKVLSAFLSTGMLSGAVLDVWENEPDIDLQLMEKLFLATPHIAGYSTDGKANGTAMSVNALSRFFNLPLKEWRPGDVPSPPEPIFSIDGKDKSDEDIIRKAVLHTYDIRSDDEKLRHSPEGFEKQRGGYPVRREFPSFSITLTNCSAKSREILEKLGFRAENS
ncbi:MAG TPA: 4-phosphoerythronate dehydrogenase PdxB [Bacteroidales bacterium]|nr:4-phosphoerythronate dehydrogenase PdxB [Bacteroidales bacterium]